MTSNEDAAPDKGIELTEPKRKRETDPMGWARECVDAVLHQLIQYDKSGEVLLAPEIHDLRDALECMTRAPLAPPVGEVARQIVNWLRVQANAEKEEKAKAVFIEAHNSCLKILEAATQSQPSGDRAKALDEARYALDGEIYALIKVKDNLPKGSFTPEEMREWSREKDQALERFWVFVTSRKSPVRAALSSPPAVDARVWGLLELIRHEPSDTVQTVATIQEIKALLNGNTGEK